MLGILIASHGDFSKGLLNSAKMFFGDNIENIDTISLYLDTPVIKFKEELLDKIEKLNDGSGVLILTDLFGGTPCNQCSELANDNIHVISGANLPILVEILGLRLSNNFNILDLVETGKDGIIYTNLLNTKEIDNSKDFFD